MIFFVGRREDFAFVDEVHLERLQNFGFGKMSDADFGHYGNGDGGHDFADDFDGGHTRDAAFFADVRWDTLERHHGASAGFFGNARLFGVGDIHDDATLEHFGQANFDAPLV